jgi:predicted nucleotidyltransferase
VDVAVAVPTWPAYEHLAAQLTRRPGPAHRFTVAGVPLDIVAFGSIEGPDRTITWPDAVTMNVLGFQEAYDCAVQAVLPGGVRINVASLPAQAALKVQAYSDRRYDTTS